MLPMCLELYNRVWMYEVELQDDKGGILSNKLSIRNSGDLLFICKPLASDSKWLEKLKQGQACT